MTSTDPLDVNLSPDEAAARRELRLQVEDRRHALSLARDIIAGVIRDRGDEKPVSLGDALFRANGDLVVRTTATLELASWLLGETNPVIHAPAEAERIVARHTGFLVDPLIVGEEEDGEPAILDVGILPAQAIHHRTALRHLATVANDTVNATHPGMGLDIVELNEAVDQAYAALDWPRYGGKVPT